MVEAGMGGSGGQLKTITQAMEALQAAKFTAVLNDNASTLSDLRLVEQTLAAATLTLEPDALARLTALTPTPPPATDRSEERSANNYGSR